MPSDKRCLESSEDIKLMVDGFYQHVKEDLLLGPIFDQVMKVDWTVHLPRMYAFWETVAFNRGGYKGDPIGKHQGVARKVELTAQHFQRWQMLFIKTVDEHFTGIIAEKVKNRAQVMSHVLSFKCAEQAFIDDSTGKKRIP